MDKVKLILEAAQKLLRVAEDLRSLADSVQAVCALITDSLQGKEVSSELKQEEKKEAEISLERVRGALADKSRAGHTAEVREIIKKHGADRLSEIDPKEYAEVLAEADALK